MFYLYSSPRVYLILINLWLFVKLRCFTRHSMNIVGHYRSSTIQENMAKALIPYIFLPPVFDCSQGRPLLNEQPVKSLQDYRVPSAIDACTLSTYVFRNLPTHLFSRFATQTGKLGCVSITKFLAHYNSKGWFITARVNYYCELIQG